MTYEQPGGSPLNYFPCRYDRSRLLFRGPRRDVSGDFLAFLGGTETYGKFLPAPFPALVEAEMGLAAVNLGCLQAGPDAYLNDMATLDLARRARVTVLQVPGALNLSNRMYAVHPRRNDRFLRASPLLQGLYPEVDFTDFAFTRHLALTLAERGAERGADRFRLLATELQTAWVARMFTLLDHLAPPVVLVWVGLQPPPPADTADLMSETPLVHAGMLAGLRNRVAALVEVVVSDRARAEGANGMAYAVQDEQAARALPGPAAHAEIAAALVPVLRGLL